MQLQAGITALAVGFGLFALACDGASDALVEPPGPSFASGPGPVVESATGSGWLLRDPETNRRRTFAFTAKKHDDGSVQGSAQFVNHTWPQSEKWLKGNAEITCLTVIGNEAWMGGYMKTGLFSTPSPDPDWEPGVYFYAQDNGQGANADPDRLSFMAVDEPLQNAADWCARTPVPEEWNPPFCCSTFDITGGNIQVDG